MALERSILEAEDSTLAVSVITDTASGNLAIDYGSYLNRIAIAVEAIAADINTIAANTTVVASAITTISSNSSVVASAITTISSNSSVTASGIDTLKTLAQGDGIRMITPYEWIGLVSSYRLYVEESGAIGLSKLQEYKDKITTLPKGF